MPDIIATSVLPVPDIIQAQIASLERQLVAGAAQYMDVCNLLSSVHTLLDRWDDIAGTSTGHYHDPTERLKIVFDKAVKAAAEHKLDESGLPRNIKEKIKRTREKIEQLEKWQHRLSLQNSVLSNQIKAVNLSEVGAAIDHLNRVYKALTIEREADLFYESIWCSE